MTHTYPPLNVEVRTPRLTLTGASDELLERLVPLVRAGVADAEPWPFDDPISFYADSPDRSASATVHLAISHMPHQSLDRKLLEPRPETGRPRFSAQP